jgi:4-hydroxy-tetrahydrodipicolinate reductase
VNLAIIGYGNMGRLIESAALARGHGIAVVVDPRADRVSASGRPIARSLDEAEGLGEADAAVEFTLPETAPENIRALAERRIPTVTGTTGWYQELEGISALVAAAGSSLVWAPNFSLGVNLFYRLAAYAAHIIDPFPEYDVGGWEGHHRKKADSPSGTAKTLADRVLAQTSRKTRVVWDALDRPPAAEELHFASLRTGSLPGIHALLFDSPADTIELRHTARNREGFALGALRAAEWLIRPPLDTPGTRRQGVFTMDDVLEGILGGSV